MEETLNLKDVVNVLKKRFILIMMVIIVAAVTSGLITHFLIKPTYQATTQLLVNQSTEEEFIDVNQVRSNIELINTYSILVKNPNILNNVLSDLNLDQSIADLSKQVTVSKTDDAQVIEVLVESESPSKSAEIVDAIASEFKQEIASIMKIDNVTILYPAIENPIPVKQDMLINVMLAVLLGLCCGVGLAFLLEYMDTSIRNEKDIEDALGIPVIGNISTMRTNQKVVNNKMIQNQAEVGGHTIES